MILKIGAIALAVILAIPILISHAVTGAVSAVFGDSAGSMDCAPAAGTGVAGYGPGQLANAAIIVAVGTQLTIPEHGQVVAIATAMQESTLRNLDHGDRDSLGLFQQRPSQGWGTPTQIMNPTHAATQFYQHLLTVPGWQQMSVNDAAQAVQRSGFPDAYAQHEQAARRVVAAVHGTACTTDTAGRWSIPAVGRCTSGFGPRSGGFHRGQDIAAPLGTTIVAASGGLVIAAGPASGYGLWVRIQHPDGTVTTYGHNHRNLVRTGQTVLAGQPIAEIGNRGHSTGPHLHFQVEAQGHAIDPVIFFRQRNLSLCPSG